MSRNRVSKNRRRFIKAGLLGFAGAMLGSGPGITHAMMPLCGSMNAMGCMGNGGRASIIDPPMGSALRDPALITNMSRKPGVVDVSLEVAWAQVNVAGRQVNLLTYNGLFPGPTIRVKRGDLLKVNFKNSLPQTGARNVLGHQTDLTNLHTHGLHVSPSGIADNVMHLVDPGQSFTHEYDLSKQDAGALCFYHPHVHGTVAEQCWAGLAGALLVEDSVPALKGIESHVLVLKDIDFQGSTPAPHAHPMDYMMGKEGPVVMVNGQVHPVLNIKSGQVVRFRIVNASTSRFYTLSLENHFLHLIGTDGGLLDKPYPVSRIIMAPGERTDVLIKAQAAPGRSRLLSLANGRGTQCQGGAQTVTLLSLVTEGKAAKDKIPPLINSDAKRLAMDPGRLQYRSMTLSMGRMAGYINGFTFEENSYFSIDSKLGTYEIWDIANTCCMDHPFHQHVNAAQVLQITGGDSEYANLYATIPGKKDTVIVPAMGKVRLLVPVMDYSGMAMMHCHILEHEDIGMMGMWNIA